MGRERMSSVDTAWLRMDSPQNLMLIIGVQVFETPIKPDDLRRLFERRLLKFRRFKQRVETDAEGSWWVDDSTFDLDRHFVLTELPGRAGNAEMQTLVARLAVEPLDPARPLWQFHLVRNFLGKQALITRVHHCVADGIALIAVMLSLTDRNASSRKRRTEAPTFGNGEGALESNPWLPYLRKVIAHPDVLVDYAQLGSHVIKDALQIALMPNDSATILKGVPGNIKAVAWNDPLPLVEINAVSKVLGVSINDVLLSCVAGAFRRYLSRNGGLSEHCEVRAMVPVNLRPFDQALELGNKFGLVPLCLPVGIANPIARLREIRRRMSELKEGYQAILAFGLLGVLGLAPKPVQKLVLEILSSKATAVMTNVPGPRQPVFLAGSKVSRIMIWVPQSGHIGVGVSILSYDGGVQFGLITDTLLCPDPQQIVDGFAPEFEKLIILLSLLPAEMFKDSAVDPIVFEQVLFGKGGCA